MSATCGDTYPASERLIWRPTSILTSLSVALRAEQAGQTMQVVEALERAATRGDADAQYGLGRAFMDGNGVAQDDGEAVRWLRRAAEQGHGAAADDLAALEATMPPEQVADAQRLAREWTPTTQP